MIEIKSYKIGIALFFYCKCCEIEYNIQFIPSCMATSMVVFLLKHPKLLQNPKYKQIYDALLEFQIEDIYFSLSDFDENLVKDLTRNELRQVVEMINDMELHDEDSKVYELRIADIDYFISHYFYT